MNRLVKALWSGEVPLARAFWEYTILYGTLANLICSLVSLMLLTTEGLEVPALAVGLLPVPYNLLAVVAVLRSAGRYDGPEHWSLLACAAAVIWALLATFT